MEKLRFVAMSLTALRMWQKLRGSLSPQGCLALLADQRFTKELHRDSTLFVQYIHKLTRLRSVENSNARARVVSEPPCIELKHINQALNLVKPVTVSSFPLHDLLHMYSLQGLAYLQHTMTGDSQSYLEALETGLINNIDNMRKRDIVDLVVRISASSDANYCDRTRMTESFYQSIVRRILSSNESLLSWEEEEPACDVKSTLLSAFEAFDSDGDGCLTQGELLGFLETVFSILYKLEAENFESFNITPTELAHVAARECFLDCKVGGADRQCLSFSQVEEWFQTAGERSLVMRAMNFFDVEGRATADFYDYDYIDSTSEPYGVRLLEEVKLVLGLPVDKEVLKWRDMNARRRIDLQLAYSNFTFDELIALLKFSWKLSNKQENRDTLCTAVMEEVKRRLVSYNKHLNMLCDEEDGVVIQTDIVSSQDQDMDGGSGKVVIPSESLSSLTLILRGLVSSASDRAQLQEVTRGIVEQLWAIANRGMVLKSSNATTDTAQWTNIKFECLQFWNMMDGGSGGANEGFMLDKFLTWNESMREQVKGEMEMSHNRYSKNSPQDVLQTLVYVFSQKDSYAKSVGDFYLIAAWYLKQNISSFTIAELGVIAGTFTDLSRVKTQQYVAPQLSLIEYVKDAAEDIILETAGTGDAAGRFISPSTLNSFLYAFRFHCIYSEAILSLAGHSILAGQLPTIGVYSVIDILSINGCLFKDENLLQVCLTRLANDISGSLSPSSKSKLPVNNLLRLADIVTAHDNREKFAGNVGDDGEATKAPLVTLRTKLLKSIRSVLFADGDLDATSLRYLMTCFERVGLDCKKLRSEVIARIPQKPMNSRYAKSPLAISNYSALIGMLAQDYLSSDFTGDTSQMFALTKKLILGYNVKTNPQRDYIHTLVSVMHFYDICSLENEALISETTTMLSKRDNLQQALSFELALVARYCVRYHRWKPSFINRLMQVSKTKIDHFRPMYLVQLAWAIGEISYLPTVDSKLAKDLLKDISRTIVDKDYVSKLPPDDFVYLMRAISKIDKLGESHVNLLRKVIDEAPLLKHKEHAFFQQPLTSVFAVLSKLPLNALSEAHFNKTLSLVESGTKEGILAPHDLESIKKHLNIIMRKEDEGIKTYK